MKKIVTMIVALMSMVFVNAQNYEVLHVADYLNMQEQYFYYCETEVGGVVVYGMENCPYKGWRINGESYCDYCDSIIVTSEYADPNGQVETYYYGCGNSALLLINFVTSNMQNPFAEPFVWKRTGESVTLHAPGNVLWSTGETTNEITVTEPGTYSVTITDACGSETYSIEVRDNVELFRATTELEHNRNQATWQTTPEQAEYVQEVNVYRNNQLVATVPYTDGVFTDNIGSADAPWQYHLVAVSNGEECPLRSYWARTISMSDLMGSQGTQTLTWTSYEQENPAKGDEVQAYGIFDVVGGNPRLVIEVGSFVNMYNYDPSNFDGYAAVAAIFSRDGKSPLDFEDCAFSNRTEAPLGLGEHEAATFSVYPNPSNGVFTVEGAGTMTVTNVLGQIIKETEIDGQYIMELPQGIYFVKMGDETRKIVVE